MEKSMKTYKCIGCGLIAEKDPGFAAAVVPAPEVGHDQLVFEQAQALTPHLESEDKPEQHCDDCAGKQEAEPEEHGAYYNIGDCPECGSHNWIHTGDIVVPLPPIPPDPPAEPKEPQPDFAESAEQKEESGFSVAVAPTPEVSEAQLAQEFATSLPDGEVAAKKEATCTQCGKVEEFDAGLTELPRCTICGSADWGQEPH